MLCLFLSPNRRRRRLGASLTDSEGEKALPVCDSPCGGVARTRAARVEGALSPLLLQPTASRQSQFDIVTLVRSGSAPVQSISQRRRYSVDALVDLVAGSHVRHFVNAGVQYQYAPTHTEWSATDDVDIITSGGAALAAQLLNTPVSNRQNARAVGLFVHDDVALGNRWAASLGLRYDDWKGSTPAQMSAAGTYAPRREFAADSNAIDWRGLAPRATLTFDLMADGKFVQAD